LSIGKDKYPGATKELPLDMPTLKGKTLCITTYVDTDHMSYDQVTRRSVTGILQLVNNTAIKWYLKRQNTVETSTHWAQLVALRIVIGLIIELRHKLRMMDLPIKGANQVLYNNKSVVISTSLPNCRLKKKSNAITYH